MKLLLLGSNGMLGQMVYKYFYRHPSIELLVFNGRFLIERPLDFVEEVNRQSVDVVLNCIGIVSQRGCSEKEFFDVNSRLPLYLASSLHKTTLLVYPSTDCVFSGMSEVDYLKATPHDAMDIYGLSKSIGELSVSMREKALVMRTSVIGPDVRINPRGLFGWLAKHPKNSTINGYTNHFWNGVTTLEWCKILEKNLIQAIDSRSSVTLQVGLSKALSKYDLLNKINSVFNFGLQIGEYLAPTSVHRCLHSDFPVGAIEKQLHELYIF